MTSRSLQTSTQHCFAFPCKPNIQQQPHNVMQHLIIHANTLQISQKFPALLHCTYHDHAKTAVPFKSSQDAL